MDELTNHRNVCTYDELCGSVNAIPTKICSNCRHFGMDGFSSPGGKCKNTQTRYSDTFAGDVCDLFEPTDRLLKEQQRIQDMILKK